MAWTRTAYIISTSTSVSIMIHEGEGASLPIVLALQHQYPTFSTFNLLIMLTIITMDQEHANINAH